MQAQDQRINTIITDKRRFKVPNYQRLYSWDQDNCEQFWEDLSRQIKMNDLNNGNADGHDHYLGALVVKDSGRTIENELSEFLVVDGQQRLTTISLLVASLLRTIHIYSDKNEDNPIYMATFRKLSKAFIAFIKVDTTDFITERDSRYNYRIELIEENNSLYRKLIDSYLEKDFEYEEMDNPLAIAFRYFMQTIKTTIVDKYSNSTKTKISLEGLNKIEAIFTAIKFNIKLIYTTLDADDEVQQIFEALNNRGAPLTDEDLIKNYFMMLVDTPNNLSKQKPTGTNGDTLYHEYWKDFEKDEWWRQKRNNSKGLTNLGFFIYVYLMQTQKSTHLPKSSNLYRDFRDYAIKIIKKNEFDNLLGIETLLSDIKKMSVLFKNYDQLVSNQGDIKRRLPLTSTVRGKQTKEARLEEFIERVASIDIYSWQLILWFGSNKDSIDDDEFISTLNIIESWIIRRKIDKISNTHFGIREICESLLDFTSKGDFSKLNVKLKTLLYKGTSNGVAILSFPGDTSISASIKDDEITVKLAKIILLAIEDKKRQKISPRVGREREVEHIMPQKWKDNWKLDPNETEESRLRYINKLGNLTLLFNEPNKSASNKGFLIKKNLYLKQDVILTQELKKYQFWRASEIDLRGEELLKYILEIWPDLDSL